MMTLPLEGGCLCCAVRYEITVAPIRIYTCHCRDCQKASTSAFTMSLAVPGDAFKVSGKELQGVFGGITDGGRTKTRWVCPDCGTCLCGGVKVGTELVGYIRNVRAGTLDDAGWVRPTIHMFVRSRQPWVIIPEGSTMHTAGPERAPS